MSLEHLGVGGIAFLALLSVGLGVIIHPIQFAVVQFFEGYWGITLIAQAIRARRIRHYQCLCQQLSSERLYTWKKLNYLRAVGDKDPVIRAQLLSRRDEAIRIGGNFPSAINKVMPTRLGNVLRRAESLAGRQYGMDALQVVPQLLLIAPSNHVDYVNDQRTQLDLAVRMTLISAAASATAVVFLWPYRFWVLVAVIPYALAYLSYRGAVIAGGHYGSALDTLINLDRFALYEQLHLQLPATTAGERLTNAKMARLFRYAPGSIEYEHPARGNDTGAASQ